MSRLGWWAFFLILNKRELRFIHKTRYSWEISWTHLHLTTSSFSACGSSRNLIRVLSAAESGAGTCCLTAGNSSGGHLRGWVQHCDPHPSFRRVQDCHWFQRALLPENRSSEYHTQPIFSLDTSSHALNSVALVFQHGEKCHFKVHLKINLYHRWHRNVKSP